MCRFTHSFEIQDTYRDVPVRVSGEVEVEAISTYGGTDVDWSVIGVEGHIYDDDGRDLDELSYEYHKYIIDRVLELIEPEINDEAFERLAETGDLVVIGYDGRRNVGW